MDVDLRDKICKKIGSLTVAFPVGCFILIVLKSLYMVLKSCWPTPSRGYSQFCLKILAVMHDMQGCGISCMTREQILSALAFKYQVDGDIRQQLFIALGQAEYNGFIVKHRKGYKLIGALARVVQSAPYSSSRKEILEDITRKFWNAKHTKRKDKFLKFVVNYRKFLFHLLLLPLVLVLFYFVERYVLSTVLFYFTVLYDYAIRILYPDTSLDMFMENYTNLFVMIIVITVVLYVFVFCRFFYTYLYLMYNYVITNYEYKHRLCT